MGGEVEFERVIRVRGCHVEGPLGAFYSFVKIHTAFIRASRKWKAPENTDCRKN